MAKSIALALLIITASPAGSPESSTPPKATAKIADNSFLMEEAYNQEEGVVQHISFMQWDQGSSDWLYGFTQEWPVASQLHQLSVTVPIQRTDASTGVADVLLNYRYQAVLTETLAFSPRLSLILDTGEFRKGRGQGSGGVQMNLPLSVDLGSRWVTHWNLGATYLNNAHDVLGNRARTHAFNYGASVIYSATPLVNAMLEIVGFRSQEVSGPGRTRWRQDVFVSPGMRFAINFQSGLQIVPGIAYAFAVGNSRSSDQLIGYLSFEHPF